MPPFLCCRALLVRFLAISQTSSGKMLGLKLVSLQALAAVVLAQKPQFPPAFPPTPARPILPSSVNYAPSVTPNIKNPAAPNAQTVCPGYKASNVEASPYALFADLTLAGPACNVYGTDVHDLSLSVTYQSQQRLAVRITPKYLAPQNHTQYILDPSLVQEGHTDASFTNKTSDLEFSWSNDPSFQFKVTRHGTGEVIFSTYGQKIVFEDQFLELITSMVPDYNVYGFAESLRGFRLNNTNFTQTFWNAYNLDNDQILDVNGHSVHPMYLETRYANGSSTSHGVYGRNAHGQEWLLRNGSITYRTLGGSFDFYFLSGPTPKQVISQYHTGIIGTPGLVPYWALGFHQLRWGYQNWTNLQDVLDAYDAQNIQVEGIMNDLDYLKVNRDFTNNPGHYDVIPGQEFLAKLHASGRYYMPILDPNIYVPNPANASDNYTTYDRGNAAQVYLRRGGNDTSWYIGTQWPGFSVFPDFLVPQTQSFWTDEIKRFHDLIQFDGFWLDVNDAVSFCTGSCGSGNIGENSIHVPFALPGDPNTSIAVDYRYPEGFELTNVTEAASASSAMMSQSAAYPTPTATPTPVLGMTPVIPGVRNLTFPPYAINNFLPGHSLVKEVISPDATHNDQYNTTEYELHNLYGHLSGRATYNALVQTCNNKRPFFLSRSTFAGSGVFAGHWGGDTNSKFGNMYFGISQALQFSIAGIPFFGVETCGFNGNADLDLCARWMQLSAWFPMYRNHNNRNTIAQEAYRWATVSEATRRIMNIRYALLPYTYTLFYQANTMGETVLRALPWEFPNDQSLKAVETQFMSGPAILVTPVLAPNAVNVSGVFPGIADGTQWYDWYTLQKVQATPGENKTLDAPTVHQPIHVRGGYIIPMQKPGNTTKTSRLSPWSLLVALDKDQQAKGDLYLDDGVSLVQNATKTISMLFANNTLTTKVEGKFHDHLSLANLTVAGITSRPSSVSIVINGKDQPSNAQFTYVPSCNSSSVLYITGLDTTASPGIWSGDASIRLA